MISGKGRGNISNLSSKGNKRGYASNPKNPFDSLSDEDFSEWFRGFVDAEGSFFIQIIDNRVRFIFSLCLHKDEHPLLKYVAQRLGVGNLSVREKSVNYTVSNKDDLVKIFGIFDKRSFNTSKNLNYIAFRQAYDLYFNRESTKVSTELRKKIIDLKNQMNKNRTDLNQPEGHSIHITRYWLLGFIEGDGYFSVNRQGYVLFGIGQTSQEIGVLEAIQKFILGLPGKFIVKRNNTNFVKLVTQNPVKGRNHKPMASIIVNQTDLLIDVLIPFFDNLIWLSKKKKDYQDWKLILYIIKQGKHFIAEGAELIALISKRMNNNRLSTNLAPSSEEGSCSSQDIQERALNLLSSPSNYELQPDGRILIKSLGTYLKGRGNVGVKVLDEKGELVFHFNSIKDCALFFNVHSRTINRRLANSSYVEFNGKNLVFKREVSLP